MPNEVRSVNTFDLDGIQSQIDNVKTEAVVDVAFVSDCNHNDTERRDLSVGNILGKPLSLVGNTESSDIIYKPIDINITKYPIPGEFVVVMRTTVGNYYLSTINITGNLNNNVDDRKKKGFVKYKDNRDVVSNEIKNSNQISTDDKIDSFFRLRKIPKRLTNYGDLSIEGRLGNVIRLTNSPNQTPIISIENGFSKTNYFIGEITYPNLTDTKFSTTTQALYNQQNTSTIFNESPRIVNRSLTDGFFVESKKDIGLVSDSNISLNTLQDLSLNGGQIRLGDDEALSPLIKGNEFAKQWEVLIEGLHEFTSILKTDGNNPIVSQAANYFKEILTSAIAPMNENDVENKYLETGKSTSKFLSKTVYTK